jgi:hypothetical protein
MVVFFDELNAAGLEAAVEQFLRTEKSFDAKKIHAHAKSFAKSHFAEHIEKLVNATLAKAQSS